MPKCPLGKKENHNQKKSMKPKKKGNKAYITCDENDTKSSDDEETNICLMENHQDDEEYFTVSNAKWYLDSICSKHMVGDKTLFSVFSHKKECLLSYGDNKKGKILVFGTFCQFPDPTIGEVILVEGFTTIKYTFHNIFLPRPFIPQK